MHAFLSFRSSACDRPRTYDRFYQKTPGNFHDPTAAPCTHGGKSHSGGVTETDSAISVCSSEEDKKTADNSAQAAPPPPAGSTSAPSQRKVKKTKKRRGELQYSRDGWMTAPRFSIYLR